ncbi:hypothetical protein As57867_016082, partial [Aphanomyces stellatus]
RFQKFFIKSGNGLPPAARGAVCDIDVGDAKPIAHRARRVRGELMPKLYDLLKGLLNFGLIRFSNSAWASPIVLVLKKGGKDIRLCIDFRDINSLQKLMRSPMPTLDSMLADFHAIEWFLSLDNASGFWVFRSTKRAHEISAFICPLGHFEWTRMAQGLKNAPMLYQRMITNALYGFVDLPPGVADVDDDGEPRDMFAIGFVRPASEMPRPANRTSFADDISDGATTWDGIVELVDRILTRLTYFNVSISASKSKFGKTCIEFLGHIISRAGLAANVRNRSIVESLEFPTTLTTMQSFLGTLNFYSRFIENYSIKSACLTELPEQVLRSAEAAYLSTPVLKHANPDLDFHVFLFCTPWALSATLCQMYDGVFHPVRFCGRQLQGGEGNYDDWAKECLALMRVLKVCYYELRSTAITVYTRHPVLKWMSTDTHNRAERLGWVAQLAPWTLTHVCIDCTLAAPGTETDAAFERFKPTIKALPRPLMPAMPKFSATDSLVVATFDGSVTLSERVGSYGVVLWQLPNWDVIWAGHGVVTDATVNVAEYNGLLSALRQAAALGIHALQVFGDSRLILHQVLDWINCKQEHLGFPRLVDAAFYRRHTCFNAPEDGLN